MSDTDYAQLRERIRTLVNDPNVSDRELPNLINGAHLRIIGHDLSQATTRAVADAKTRITKLVHDYHNRNKKPTDAA